MNKPTPRTDSEIEDLANGLRHMADDHMCCRAAVLGTIELLNELKRERDQLERELNEARLEIQNISTHMEEHQCRSDDSLHMDVLHLCQQSDQLSKVCDAYYMALADEQINKAEDAYNSLPHVIAKGKTK